MSDESPVVSPPSTPIEPNRVDVFNASDEDVARFAPQVVFRWNDSSGIVCARLERSAFRKRSKIVKILESCSGVVFLPSRKEHYIPAYELSTVIRLLRDKEISFVVHSDTAAALQPTAPLRKQLVELGDVHSADDLRKAMLVPRVVPGPTGFVVEGLLAPQLKAVFPEGDSFGERKTKATNVSPTDLPLLLHRARSAGLRLFLSKEAQRVISDRAAVLANRTAHGEAVQSIGEESIDLARPDAIFALSEARVAILLLRKEVLLRLQKILELLSALKREGRESRTFPGYIEYPIQDSRLTDLFQSIQDVAPAPIPRSPRFETLLSVCASRSSLVKRNRDYEVLRDTELETPPAFTSLVARLFPHQRIAVRWLMENDRGLLGDDMGLGKTLSVLSAFALLQHSGQVDRLLVLCPNSLTRNWKREAEEWLPDLSVVQPGNEKRARESTLRSLSWGARRSDLLILNYEAIRIESVLNFVRIIVGQERTMVCLDESQRVKNHATKLFQALREIIPQCSRRVLLSGTPTPQQFSDIWAQMLLLDDGERFGSNYYRWLETVAVLGTRYSEFAVKSYRTAEVEEGRMRVQEVLLRRRKEDVVDLPEKTFSVRDVELTGEQLSRFEELREELLLRVSSCDGEVFFKRISSILEEYLRAVQLASNPRLIDPEWKGEPAKFLELDEIVAEIVEERGEKIVVWTNFVQNVKELVARYSHLGSAAYYGDVSPAERQKIVQAFQSEKSPRVLVALPAAGGVGITLTAAQTAVYIDKTWNAEHYMQSVDRIHRIGQTGTVHIIGLHACKIDQLIARSLRRKADQQAHLLGDNDRVGFRLESQDYILPTREELLEAIRD